jgi:hypothetical protein
MRGSTASSIVGGLTAYLAVGHPLEWSRLAIGAHRSGTQVGCLQCDASLILATKLLPEKMAGCRANEIGHQLLHLGWVAGDCGCWIRVCNYRKASLMPSPHVIWATLYLSMLAGSCLKAVI